MNAIEVQHLVKKYNDKLAVDDLSFSLKTGEILGLIGPNGAGKSSTIKMVLDFIKPDSGNIAIFGQSMTEELKNRIGYLPEERGLYKNVPVLELIVYLAALKGIDKKTAKERAIDLLKRTGLYDVRNNKIKEMSKGMAQTIQFIVTILHQPDLIILDEPFSGLDPVNTDLMKRLILSERDNGKAIILSTHQMNQIEELCDSILMVNKGKAVFFGDLKETIRSRFMRHSVKVSVDGDLGSLPGVVEKRVNRDLTELILEPAYSPQIILDEIRKSGITVYKFEVSTPSLNDIFLEIVGGAK